MVKFINKIKKWIRFAKVENNGGENVSIVDRTLMSLLTIIFILVQLFARIEDEVVKPVYDAWETQTGIIKSLLKLYFYFKKAT